MAYVKPNLHRHKLFLSARFLTGKVYPRPSLRQRNIRLRNLGSRFSVKSSAVITKRNLQRILAGISNHRASLAQGGGNA